MADRAPVGPRRMVRMDPMSGGDDKRSPCAETVTVLAVLPEEPFVLDRAENPHPIMLAGAIAARAAWRAYLAAMCDATGETPAAIEAWMDRQEGRHA